VVVGPTELTSGVDRGQLYILSLGVLMAALRSSRTMKFEFLDQEVGGKTAKLNDLLLITSVGLLVLSTFCWTLVTIASVSQQPSWSQKADIIAWSGAIVLVSSTYVTLRILSQVSDIGAQPEV
jgi:hypothetical protein